MTPSRSRDEMDSAGADADDEQREVTDPDGDAADADAADPRLRAMRAVWLSMRDESPPEAGLTALLAAARAKAEVMRPPTVWQRALAMLRRPPVLALATVLLLVGGAVLVGARMIDEPEALHSAPVVHSADAVAEVPSAETWQLTGAVTGSAAPVSPAIAQETVQKTKVVVPPASTGDVAGSSVHAEDRRQAVLTTTPRPPQPSAQPASTERPKVTGERSRGAAGPGLDIAKTANAEANVPAGPPPPPPAQVGTGAPTRRLRGGTLGGENRYEGGEAPAGQAADDRPASPPPVAADEAPVVTEASEKPKPVDGKGAEDTLADLYRQCESAARRGDCVEAKRVLERINRTDRSYQKRAAKVPAMAKCLAQ